MAIRDVRVSRFDRPKSRAEIQASIARLKKSMGMGVNCKRCRRVFEEEKLRKGHCSSCVKKITAEYQAKKRVEAEEAAIREQYKDSMGIF